MKTEIWEAGNIFLADIIFYPLTFWICLGFFAIILLLATSALISGSEVAYFSLNPSNIKYLREGKSLSHKLVIKLLGKPKRLLAAILVANNFVNIGIVILSSLFFIYENNQMKTGLAVVDFSSNPALGFVFQVIIVTFLLLLFGEILPKVYASRYALRFSLFMAYPLYVIEKIVKPVSAFLIYPTSYINKKFARKRQNISMDDLSQALDLTSDSITEDKEILEGIVKFGNIEVKDILRPRLDVVAVDISITFKKLVSIILEAGYSRIPVYTENFDNIKGVLYIKDLLAHIHKGNSFKWQSLVRPPYFVPESKKINDLLEEFQTNKIHMAIVVDEYGGTSGIVTLEDILEEIVGEISDEFDSEQMLYTKIDSKNYVFEGRTMLNDFYKIVNTSPDVFEEIKGDADTLAGLILELMGEIPEKGKSISFKKFTFKIEAVDNRRIKKIKVSLK